MICTIFDITGESCFAYKCLENLGISNFAQKSCEFHHPYRLLRFFSRHLQTAHSKKWFLKSQTFLMMIPSSTLIITFLFSQLAARWECMPQEKCVLWFFMVLCGPLPTWTIHSQEKSDILSCNSSSMAWSSRILRFWEFQKFNIGSNLCQMREAALSDSNNIWSVLLVPKASNIQI